MNTYVTRRWERQKTVVVCWCWRGRTRDTRKVVGTKEGCCGQGSMPLLSRAMRVIYSCLNSHGLCPKHAAQPHECPGSEQLQDVLDRERHILWNGSPQKASMIHTAPGGQVGVCGLSYSSGTCWHPWSMLLPQTVSRPEALVNVCGLCCLWRPGGWMCSVLPLEAMLMFKIQAAIKDHVDVCGPCCDWRLCGCLRSILSKEPMLIPTVQVTTKGRVDVCGLGCLWRPC